MNITAKEYIDIVAGEHYVKETISTTAAKFHTAGVQESFEPVLEKFKNSVEQEKLVQAGLLVDYPSGPTRFYLETGIINLSFADVKKVDNFFLNLDEVVPVNVYLVVNSEDINASHFRIDKIASVDEMLANSESFAVKVIEQVAKQVAIIEENQANKADE
ncbi:hypothetical protein LB941_10525 [Ligilactobacillus sp. WILCCON 0076]|uniref:Uncharacterized protein n=1 Tax=Ligilactobacillus ubinensis TaxID=2876789 RepID=A0A9X2FRP7_9LACO|nr:hypothetical protein [Ligilactobacillus ubinensis]MCP0887763.1 hypothetical protein [Ligilactobacillus ubinensis]